ncbi:MAG: DUF3027 domain-containing protein [Actinomycetales bacterium]
MTPPRTRAAAAPKADAVLEGAVDLAREAALQEAAPGEVGEHLGTQVEAERVVTHFFACDLEGYGGWRWSVTLARAPRSKTATVDEVVLLPGPDALLPPAWVPWDQRVRPGDLGPGDLLPTAPDDPRLVPGYAATGDEDEDAVATGELGLGRPRVLSREGRDEAAERWYDGPAGPHAPEAEAAAAALRCGSCGFLTLLAGSLRQVFGVCANEWSPSDGRVVSFDHGCGAHSETVVPVSAQHVDPPILDELGYETVAVDRTDEA